jgi:hypothetical protein
VAKTCCFSLNVARASCAWFTGETPVPLCQTEPVPAKILSGQHTAFELDYAIPQQLVSSVSAFCVRN